MEASLNLLNNYVKVDDQNPLELAEKITRIGHEVEGHRTLAKGNKLVIGYVRECVDHSDSDHLHVCQVEIAPGEVTQIVCGAPNIAAGLKVIVALLGCELFGGKISKGKIRGEESNGMICSIAELIEDTRLLKDEDKDGIHVLDEDAPIGEEALSYLGLDDFILDIGLTPNRADAMAMTSLAYEVAAVLDRKVTLPKINKYDELKSDIKVNVETPLCDFFGVKLVKGVETHESPKWLRNYLLASGVKPINNIVDISNFVMIETGQPIHMYDYDKLKEKTFTIKTGFSGQYTMLDGNDYEIKEEDLIVSTDNSVGCVAGVMGADDTKIDDQTVNIVIEAATFDGPTLRNTARRLNLLTDASSHYIKGAIDTANSLNVLDRCVDLLKQEANAKEIYETVSTTLNIETKEVEVSTSRVNGLLGTSFTSEDIAKVFDKLCFTYSVKDDVFNVTIPTYRNDITMDADLIEEVARLYGYDNLPSTLPVMSTTKGMLTPTQAKEKFLRHALMHLGLHETLTYTLTSPNKVNDFNLFHSNDDKVELMWPLGLDHSVTRKSLIPHLLETVKYNNDHAIKDVNIFEIANTYAKEEISLLSIALSGNYIDIPWLNEKVKASFYVIKGMVETLLEALNIESSRYTLVRVEKDSPYFHPGRSAYIKMGKEIVGVIGQIHPLMAKKYDVGEVYISELNLTSLLEVRSSALKVSPIPQYPSVERDLALVVDKDVAANEIEKVIFKSDKIVRDTKIFDIYEGEHIEEGKKSVAISITFQDYDKTLDEETINNVLNKVLDATKKAFNATLRG